MQHVSPNGSGKQKTKGFVSVAMDGLRRGKMTYIREEFSDGTKLILKSGNLLIFSCFLAAWSWRMRETR